MDLRIKQVIQYKEEQCYCNTLEKCGVCKIIEPLINYLRDIRLKELDDFQEDSLRKEEEK